MQDRILEGFLLHQYEQGMALAAESDLIELLPFGARPYSRFVVHFLCRGLIREPSGEIAEANRFTAGIWFPRDYLVRVEPLRTVSWLGPPNVFHPNISGVAPVVCLGRLVPGTPLIDLIYQLFELIAYQKVTMREDDALNIAACAWARQNTHRFPIDPRPLKRRTVAFELCAAGADGPAPEARGS